MPRIVFAAAGLLTAAGLIWPLRLLFVAAPWPEAGSFLIAADLAAMAAIPVTALLLSPGRWVRVLASLLGGVWGALALATGIDWSWILGTATGAAGTALLWTRPLDGWLRNVKPDRTPPRASALALGLAALPGAVGAWALPDVTPGGWALAGLAAAGAWAYARALPATLWVVRLGLLPLGAVAAVGLYWWSGTGLVAVCAGLTALAWSRDARLAAERPQPRRAEAVSLLPEAVPPSLMESAGFDRRGRSRGDLRP